MGVIAYWVPKSSSSVHEWEDGCGYDLSAGRLAVADGATSSFGAQRWAHHLVTAFLDEPPRTVDTEAFEHWLSEVAASWSATFDEATIDAGEWYLGEAAARGGFATFCGVQVTVGETDLRWRCFAVGDACLFHVRSGELLVSFPIATPEHFDDSPALVSTNVYGGDRGARHLQVLTGTAQAGDTLLLASDALAAWALRRAEVVGDVWEVLDRIDHAGLRCLVDSERQRAVLADDDVTLLRWKLVED